MKFIQKMSAILLAFMFLFPLGLGAMSSEMTHADACEILGVESGATGQEINTAYKSLALKWHPDKNIDPNAAKQFQQISEAKNILLKVLPCRQENSENIKARKEAVLRIINEKKWNLTLYDLIGVSNDATDSEIGSALDQFGPIWEDFDEVIDYMVQNYNETTFDSLRFTLTHGRAEYNQYLELSYEQKLKHKKFRPYWNESFSTWYPLKKEALEITGESLMGIAGGVVAGAAYLGLAALTKSSGSMKTLPAVMGFYGYTTLTAALGFSIGLKIKKTQSWSLLLGIGARALVFGAVTKYAAPYVAAGFKWASFI